MLELALIVAALAAFGLLLALAVELRRQAAAERERTRQWLHDARTTFINSIQPRDKNGR